MAHITQTLGIEHSTDTKLNPDWVLNERQDQALSEAVGLLWLRPVWAGTAIPSQQDSLKLVLERAPLGGWSVAVETLGKRHDYLHKDDIVRFPEVVRTAEEFMQELGMGKTRHPLPTPEM